MEKEHAIILSVVVLSTVLKQNIGMYVPTALAAGCVHRFWSQSNTTVHRTKSHTVPCHCDMSYYFISLWHWFKKKIFHYGMMRERKKPITYKWWLKTIHCENFPEAWLFQCNQFLLLGEKNLSYLSSDNLLPYSRDNRQSWPRPNFSGSIVS